MELPELRAFVTTASKSIESLLPSFSTRVSLAHEMSPNPLCFIEIDGACFAQASFWANNEYRIEAMRALDNCELLNLSGEFHSSTEAHDLVVRMCQRISDIA